MKFAILHHDACGASRHHYRIDDSGAREVLRGETEPGELPQCIDIVLSGDADQHAPEPAQLDALRTLLRELKLRYPDIAVGGHRQIRGQRTTCPGRYFPLTELRDWSASELLVERDAALQDIVDRQYRP